MQQGLSLEMQRMVDECPRTFYAWSRSNHREIDHDKYFEQQQRCCFWHWVGGATRTLEDGSTIIMPNLPYQRMFLGLLRERKKIIVRKARGIGVSTWLLYWIFYMALTQWKPGDRACIITGNALRLSEDLISRLKGLAQKYFPEVFTELQNQSSTIAVINGVIIEGMPMRFVSLRGYDRVRCVISDENDWYPISQQRQLRMTVEPLEHKPNSNSHIILVSTPASAFGVMREIESDQNSGYYSLVLTYHYGLEGPIPIFSKDKLEEARKRNPIDFAREFECQYINAANNVFSNESIDRAVMLGRKYDPVVINKEAQHALGVDPGFGSSATGFTLLEYSDGIIKVVFSEEYSRESFNGMVQKVFDLRRLAGNLSNVYIDMANVEFIEAIKQDFREDSNWQRIHEKLAYCRKNKTRPENFMKVIPVSFGLEGATMLSHCKNLLENDDALIAINPKWNKLIDALRSCKAQDYKVDKQNMLYSDAFDSFRLAMKYFSLER